MTVREGPRSRRHHVVPRFHLRGFANENRMLRQIDLQTGTYRDVSIGDASVIKDFYTIELGDGTRSDEWEQRFAEVENRRADGSTGRRSRTLVADTG